MLKKIYLFAFLTVAMVAVPASVKAENDALLGIMEVAQDKNVVVSADGNVVSVTGGAGMTLEVISLTGRHVSSIKIESASQRLELNLPKGCYILKIGDVVRKIYIR